MGELRYGIRDVHKSGGGENLRRHAQEGDYQVIVRKNQRLMLIRKGCLIDPL